MKNILCFGDSNTWGLIPGSLNLKTMYEERYPRSIRWTGLLQKNLGDNYYIIEEGLNGRTTNIDYPDRIGFNGKNYLLPCLYTHAPLDLVVLMLGCNDLKKCFNNRSAKEIANGIEELVLLVKSTTYGTDMKSPPKILVVGYPILTHEKGLDNSDMFENAISRSMEFDKYYGEIAKKLNCSYFNSAPFIKLSHIDGTHFDEKNHKIFSELIENKIKEIFR